MLKILSAVCGGELSGKDIARDCLGAAGAILAIGTWSLCCYLLTTGWQQLTM